MIAVIANRYGPASILKVGSQSLGTLLPGSVRVRVLASSVTTGDVKLRGLKNIGVFWLPIRIVFGLFRPRNKIPGMDFSGVIDAVGSQVEQYEVGDCVFGTTTSGAHAQFVDVKSDSILTMHPHGRTHFEAAATPFGGLAALYFLRDLAKVKAGEQIAIVGACGSVGSFAVQLAKRLGCKVTAICSRHSFELAKSLGADDVIDRHDSHIWDEPHQYDVILDTIGKTDANLCRGAIRPDGRHVFVAFGVKEIVQSLITGFGSGPKVLVGTSMGSCQDLEALRDILEEGTIKPVIDSVFTLDHIVEAHERVETGSKHGAVVLQVAS